MSARFGTQPKGKKLATGIPPTRQKAPRKSAARSSKKLDTAATEPVECMQSQADAPATQETAPATAPNAPPPAAQEQKKMELSFTRSNAARKDNRLVIFNFADGRPGSVQFLRTAFGETVPETITMHGDFAEKTEKVAKVKETPAERKARLAALPKLTVAEKIAKAEERIAKMKAKLETAGQKSEGQEASL